MNAVDPRRGAHLLRAARFLPSGGTSLWGWAFAPFGRKILDIIDARLERGRLEVWLPDGSFRVLGGRAEGHGCEVHLKRWQALFRLANAGSGCAITCALTCTSAGMGSP